MKIVKGIMILSALIVILGMIQIYLCINSINETIKNHTYIPGAFDNNNVCWIIIAAFFIFICSLFYYMEFTSTKKS